MTTTDPTPLPGSEPQRAEFADVLRRYWSFGDYQQHTHSWHEREDFIGKVLPGLLDTLLACAVRAAREEAIEECAAVAHRVYMKGDATVSGRIECDIRTLLERKGENRKN